MKNKTNFDRRHALGLLASIPVLLTRPVFAYAEDDSTKCASENQVPFSKENASAAALNLAATFGIADLVCSEIIPLFNEDDCFIGYIVTLRKNDNPNGYVVLDRTSENQFTDFSFAANSRPPIIVDEQFNLPNSHSLDETENAQTFGAATKISPFEYRVKPYYPVDTLDSETILDDYTISADYIFSSGKVTYMKTWPQYYGIESDQFILDCGRYACAVVACYVLLGFLVNYTSPDGGVNKAVFDQLWTYTNTKEYIDEVLGIPCGATGLEDATKGLAKYCNDKYGKYGNYQVYDQVTPAVITDAIDKEYGCLLSVRRQGFVPHACVVEGYVKATMPNGLNATYFIIYDGWYSPGRYVDLTPYQHETSYPFGAGLIK